MRLTDDDVAREYVTWSDSEVREHYEASRREARVQFDFGDRDTAISAQRCRQTAERFSRELLRRAKARMNADHELEVSYSMRRQFERAGIPWNQRWGSYGRAPRSGAARRTRTARGQDQRCKDGGAKAPERATATSRESPEEQNERSEHWKRQGGRQQVDVA